MCRHWSAERGEQLDGVRVAGRSDWTPADPGLRIGDREREWAGDELRGHFSAGRLDVDEFSSRLDEVWRAATAADLAAAMRDLPPARPGPDRRPSPVDGLVRTAARVHVRSYLTFAAILVGIWLLTSPGGYFWPAWPLLFWGWFVFHHARSARRWDRRHLEAGGRS